MENTEKRCRLRIDYHWQLSEGCGEDCAPIIDDIFDNAWAAMTKMHEVMPYGYEFDDGDTPEDWNDVAEPFAKFCKSLDSADRYILATLEPVNF